MLGPGNVDQFRRRAVDADDVGSDAAHRALGQHERLAHQLQRLWLEASEGGASLVLEPQVLGDDRAVAQGQHPVVGAVLGQPPLGQHRQVVGVELVQVRAVDAVDGAVGVGQDRPAPHMAAARQPLRAGHRLQGLGVGAARAQVQALHPAVGLRTAEGGHGPAQVPLVRLALHEHHVPAPVAPRGPRRRARRRIEAPHGRLLPPVASTLGRPRRRPVPVPGPRTALEPVKSRHQASLR